MLRLEVDTSRFVKNLVGQFRIMKEAAFIAIDRSSKDIYIEEMKRRIKKSSPSGLTYFFRTGAGRHEERMPLTMKTTTFGTYVASAEGDPPGKLSGHLLSSFESKTFYSRGHTRIISIIGNTAPYSLYLEYGSPVGGGRGWPRSYMAPRPFMAPVIYDSRINHKMLRRVRALMRYAGQTFGAR